MSTQHTAGPWEAKLIREGRIFIKEEKTGRTIAFSFEGEGDKANINNWANARLIAAAPELLMLANLYALDFTDEKQARAEFGDAAVNRELQRRAIVAKATHQ